MSHSRESTIQTFLSFSIDSELNEELLSGQNTPSKHNKIRIQDLLMEIELINEDRQRLKKENLNLKNAIEKNLIKNMQIELLSKVATKALDELYINKKVQSISPMKKISCKIRIKSPQGPSFKRSCDSFIIPLKSVNESTSNTSSPLKTNRNNSSKIRVCRNFQKYPK